MFQAQPRDNIEFFWFESLESLALHLIFRWKFAGSSPHCLSLFAVKDYCMNPKSEKNCFATKSQLDLLFTSQLTNPISEVLKIVCIRSFSIHQHNLDLLRNVAELQMKLTICHSPFKDCKTFLRQQWAKHFLLSRLLICFSWDSSSLASNFASNFFWQNG